MHCTPAGDTSSSLSVKQPQTHTVTELLQLGQFNPIILVSTGQLCELRMRLLTSVLLLISTTLTAAFDCGPGIGPCPAGQCCSESNWCGSTVDYCKGPQCQLDYSDSCDAL
jgi:hypothetical protein